MSRDYWHKQSAAELLFPNMEWGRPQNRQLAGKLLVVGGHAHSFAAPAEGYNQALKAGAGATRVLLPSALKPAVGKVFEAGEYAPSTPSGSFARQSLAELLGLAAWADGVLFAGDLGRNSETAVLLEKFLTKSPAAATLTKDAADYITSAANTVLHRSNTLLVLSLSQLQRLGTAAHLGKPVTFGMDILRLAEWLHEFTLRFAPFIIVKHLGNIFVAVKGKVSTTNLPGGSSLSQPEPWRVKTAANASVWWLQNPAKPFEALTTAVSQTM